MCEYYLNSYRERERAQFYFLYLKDVFNHSLHALIQSSKKSCCDVYQLYIKFHIKNRTNFSGQAIILSIDDSHINSSICFHLLILL